LVSSADAKTTRSKGSSKFRYEDWSTSRYLARWSVLLFTRLRIRRSFWVFDPSLVRSSLSILTQSRIDGLIIIGNCSFLTAYTTVQCPELDPDSLAPSIPLIVSNFTLGIGRVFSGFLADALGPVNCLFFSFFAGVSTLHSDSLERKLIRQNLYREFYNSLSGRMRQLMDLSSLSEHCISFSADGSLPFYPTLQLKYVSPSFASSPSRAYNLLPLLALRYPRTSDHHRLHHSWSIARTVCWRESLWSSFRRNRILSKSSLLLGSTHARWFVMYLTSEVPEGETDIGEIVDYLYVSNRGCIDLHYYHIGFFSLASLLLA